jgi:hypothetical protein
MELEYLRTWRDHMRSLTAKIVQGASYVQVKHKVGDVSFELEVPPAKLNGGIMGYKHSSESYQAWVLQTSIWPGYSNSGPDSVLSKQVTSDLEHLSLT